jgi:adenosylcobinamide-GDP ribazoletransferase
MIRIDLAAALSLLTRLPIGWLFPPNAEINHARAIWAYPIVGALVGLIGAAIYAACHSLGLPPALAALWTLAGMLLTTGALHEDGLADTADGFGGGRTSERKLEIMRDSRIGSYGALALLLSTAIRVTTITTLAHPSAVTASLIAAGLLARTGMLLPLRLLPSARPNGLGASVAQGPFWAAPLACLLAVLTVLALLPAPRAVLLIAATTLTAGLMTLIARRQIGGTTGDVLGATAVAVECVVLTLCAIPLE